MNNHYKEAADLAVQLSTLWNTYSSLLAEEQQLLQIQVVTQQMTSSSNVEDIQLDDYSIQMLVVMIWSNCNILCLAFFIFKQDKSTQITTSTSIIGEVDTTIDASMLKNFLDVNAKIMVIDSTTLLCNLLKLFSSLGQEYGVE